MRRREERVLSAIEGALERVPREHLGRFPTPVRKVETPEGSSFWVKDEGASSELYGGNKLRKIEYLLADARSKGVSKLVVQGELRSHTTVAFALHGRKAGFAVSAVVYPHGDCLEERVPDPRLEACGARTIVCGGFLSMVSRARLEALRRGAMLVPFGGSSALTTLGHVRGGLELCRQVAEGLLPEPDLIYLAHASGGTVAGLLIGLAMGSSRSRVVAVQTVEPAVSGMRRLGRLVRDSVTFLGAGGPLFEAAMAHLAQLDGTRIGRGYFSRDEKSECAVQRAGLMGIDLDPAFTGRAMAVMLSALETEPNKRYLFWNTHDGNQGMQ